MFLDLLTYRNRFESSCDLLPYFSRLDASTVIIEGGMLGETARTIYSYDGRALPESLRCRNAECTSGRLPLASLTCSLLQAMTEGKQVRQCRRAMCPGNLLPARRRSRPCSYCYCITVTATYRDGR